MTVHSDVVALLARVDTATLIANDGNFRSASAWRALDGRDLTPDEINMILLSGIGDVRAAAALHQSHADRLDAFATKLDAVTHAEIRP